MREIKFRAWDKVNKKMVDDADFIHINLNGEILVGGDWCGACDQNKYSTEEKGKENYLLMQYTGVKDKNGKEIYEGDIIKWGHINGYEENPHRIAIVEFNPDIQFNCINLEFIFRYGCFNYQNTDEAVEVIGNIYENPELIERNY